jgi:hypothetical protein
MLFESIRSVALSSIKCDLAYPWNLKLWLMFIIVMCNLFQFQVICVTYCIYTSFDIIKSLFLAYFKVMVGTQL